jgi:hypothetical protein
MEKNERIIADFVNRAALQTGFDREKYVESALPTVFSNLVVVVFFGNLNSEVIFSSLLLHKYLQNHHKDKYVIVCSWPGHFGLYPYADEYWSVNDNMSLREMADKSLMFNNQDKRFEVYARNLRKYFENVVTWEDVCGYYEFGLTNKFLQNNNDIQVLVPTPTTVNLELRKAISNHIGGKLLIYPVRVGGYWQRQEHIAKFKQGFWLELCHKLLECGILPVVYQNYATYDISPHFGDKCLYVSERNLTSVLGAMRLAGCVLDVYSGISRLALAARCPFIACCDRQSYAVYKDWEINDLLAQTAYKYIFSFPTIIESENYREIINNIINVFKRFNSTIVSLAEEPYVSVNYNKVRKHKAKRVGMRFIKVERMVFE